jgi:hypothetical protein
MAASKKKTPLIDQWAIRQVPGNPEDNPYMHPGLRNAINGVVLTGYVSGHPRLSDGPVTTSRLVEIDIKHKIARTKNTAYKLGEPDPDFLRWLKSQGKNIEDLVGEVV